ncbi:hypothetical protein SK128_012739 [Halocaridina rubra]|uniref:Uncharacterized protein n=1 Tax=Halocaridina rubra TaxID=373956 RepID=A0AAN8WXW2_HALRR
MRCKYRCSHKIDVRIEESWSRKEPLHVPRFNRIDGNVANYHRCCFFQEVLSSTHYVSDLLLGWDLLHTSVCA